MALTSAAGVQAQGVPERSQIPELLHPHLLRIDVTDTGRSSRLPDPAPGVLPVVPGLPLQHSSSADAWPVPTLTGSGGGFPLDRLERPVIIVDGLIVEPAVIAAIRDRVREIRIHRGAAAMRFGVSEGSTAIEITTRGAI